MEQRRLRLGDILDDYCPRERRVTNHAVVAMIEEDVKQTRCTTCDAEHAYKGARVPKRRKKETPAALYKEVLAGLSESEGLAVAAVAAPTPIVRVPDEPVPVADPGPTTVEPVSVNQSAEDFHPPMHSDDNDQHDESRQGRSEYDGGAPAFSEEAHPDDAATGADGPVHRPLIRATLPRPEGQKDARPLPEFTVRHANGRGPANGHGNGNFRGDRMRMRAGAGSPNGNGQREVNGNRAHTGGARFHGGGRPAGPGRPQGGRGGGPSGFRSGNAGPHGKRGRGSRG